VGHKGYEGDDDDIKHDEGKAQSMKDWDCPDCNANNPLDEALGDGAEVRCNYCGNEYKVKLMDSGRFKFKEM
jgi:hypothetical protein